MFCLFFIPVALHNYGSEMVPSLKGKGKILLQSILFKSETSILHLVSVFLLSRTRFIKMLFLWAPNLQMSLAHEFDLCIALFPASLLMLGYRISLELREALPCVIHMSLVGTGCVREDITPRALVLCFSCVLCIPWRKKTRI